MESKIFLYDRLIGERIKFYRKKRGLTQASLSAVIGVSAQQLQKYEIGKNRISASRIKQLSEILDVPAHYFLNDPKEQSAHKKYTLNESFMEGDAGKLIYHYSLIKSEKIKKLLVQSSSIYVESGM
jgi:transcriptional regulator with XRE-family HTH domain